MFLITNTSLDLIPSNGIRMEFERAVGSYRLKPGVSLNEYSKEEKI